MKKLLMCLLIGATALTGCKKEEVKNSAEEVVEVTKTINDDVKIGAHMLAEVHMENYNDYYNGETLYALDVDVYEDDSYVWISYIAYDKGLNVIACATFREDVMTKRLREAEGF